MYSKEGITRILQTETLLEKDDPSALSAKRDMDAGAVEHPDFVNSAKKLARGFGLCLQVAIESGHELFDVADEALYDLEGDWVDEAVLSLACNYLYWTWRYGDELRVWYNDRLGRVTESLASWWKIERAEAMADQFLFEHLKQVY